MRNFLIERVLERGSLCCYNTHTLRLAFKCAANK